MQLEPAGPSPDGFGLAAAAMAGGPSVRVVSWASSRRTGRLAAAVTSPRDRQAPDVLGSEAEDSALVRRCLAGDERAFEHLFQRHRGAVTRLVYRMLGASPELEDLVQEVFIQVLRSLATFRDEARFSTWLYRVALNVVLMHRRAAGRRPRLVGEQHAAPALDAAPSAHEALETRRRVTVFYGLLERLSEKKRAVFVLHELEGLTPARIGEIVQAPVLTVRTRLFYARRELARLIEEEPALAAALAELEPSAVAEPGARGSTAPPEDEGGGGEEGA